MRAILLTVAMMMLAGCAPNHVWMKKTATDDEVKADNAFCQYEAVKATGGLRGDAYDLAVRKNEIIALCLQNRGYVLTEINR